MDLREFGAFYCRRNLEYVARGDLEDLSKGGSNWCMSSRHVACISIDEVPVQNWVHYVIAYILANLYIVILDPLSLFLNVAIDLA